MSNRVIVVGMLGIGLVVVGGGSITAMKNRLLTPSATTWSAVCYITEAQTVHTNKLTYLSNLIRAHLIFLFFSPTTVTNRMENKIFFLCQ